LRWAWDLLDWLGAYRSILVWGGPSLGCWGWGLRRGVRKVVRSGVPAPVGCANVGRASVGCSSVGRTKTDISSVAYKTPWKNHREGTILPVFVSICM